jgi:hypothetical protein
MRYGSRLIVSAFGFHFSIFRIGAVGAGDLEMMMQEVG